MVGRVASAAKWAGALALRLLVGALAGAVVTILFGKLAGAVNAHCTSLCNPAISGPFGAVIGELAALMVRPYEPG